MIDRTTLLFALPGFRVLNVTLEPDGGRLVLVESVAKDGGCPSCGVMSSRIKDRPICRLRDLYATSRRLGAALHQQAFCSLGASPGARAYYDALRARNIGQHAALRQLANRRRAVPKGLPSSLAQHRIKKSRLHEAPPCVRGTPGVLESDTCRLDFASYWPMRCRPSWLPFVCSSLSAQRCIWIP